jgi:hypothetical protein
MYIINNKGPNIDPCGTPDLFIPQFEDFPAHFEVLFQPSAFYLQDMIQINGHSLHICHSSTAHLEEFYD